MQKYIYIYRLTWRSRKNKKLIIIARQRRMNLEIYLSPLEIKKDNKSRYFIELESYNHIDYIEDVLAEHFDFDYDFRGDDPYIIGIYEKSKTDRFREIIEQINMHHKTTKELYKTI